MIHSTTEIYNTSHCSFRTCATIVVSLAKLLNITCKKPSATTIRNWVLKCGYAAYTVPPQFNINWCIIIDESVSIGREKLLLILGIPLSDWSFERPLCQADATVLHIQIAESWKGETIATAIRALSKKITIRYCVSDRGNSILSAMKMTNLLHISDCSHEWARLKQNCYANDELFTQLVSKISMTRKRWTLSHFSHIMPPTQRSKSRFLNVFPLIEWIEDVWEAWEFIDPVAHAELSYLIEYKH